MLYEGRIYRPPSEADAWILQATIGCSWNNCTYCDMYRDKAYRERPVAELIAEVEAARRRFGPGVDKVFVADGDALGMPTDAWLPLLVALRKQFPRLRRVSAYATAQNLLEKSVGDLAALRAAGLTRLYIGPESGDEQVMRAVAKGPRPSGASRNDPWLFDAHVAAAQAAKAAGLELSAIFLLGAGGVARSEEHALGSARLATAMDPAFLSALTLTVVPGTPLDRTRHARGWVLPGVTGLLRELRTFCAEARPTDAVFRTNHASNYLPLAGNLPRDRDRLVRVLDAAIAGAVPLRPERARGL